MQITEEDRVGVMMVNSSHGTMRFEAWCKSEVERLKEAGIYSVVKYKLNAQKEKVCYIVREVDDNYKRIMLAIYDKKELREKKRAMKRQGSW